jgi:hypothetical protein
MSGTGGGVAGLVRVFLSIGSFIVGVALLHVWSAASRPAVCDTTYIYEGYKAVDLPSQLATAGPRYKLIAWADGDPALNTGASRQPNFGLTWHSTVLQFSAILTPW